MTHRNRRDGRTVFEAHAAALDVTVAPAAETAPAPAPGRVNRHTGAERANGSAAPVVDRNVVRGLAWAAPVVAPTAGGALAGAALVAVMGPAALLALPWPVLALGLGLAFGLGRAMGADGRHVRAVLEAGPGERLAVEAAEHTPDLWQDPDPRAGAHGQGVER